MLYYRLYHLHPRTSTIVQAEDFHSTTDADAMKHARRGLEGPAELWLRGRLIASLDREPEPSPGLAPATAGPQLVIEP